MVYSFSKRLTGVNCNAELILARERKTDTCSQEWTTQILQRYRVENSQSHHQILITQSSLTLSYYQFLKSIAPGEYSRLRIVSLKMYTNYSSLANTDASVYVSMSRRWSWVCLVSPAVANISFVLLGWFERWVVNGHTAAVLLDVASRICSKKPVAFLYGCFLHFSQFLCLSSKRCVYTVVKTKSQIEKKCFLGF